MVDKIFLEHLQHFDKIGYQDSYYNSEVVLKKGFQVLRVSLNGSCENDLTVSVRVWPCRLETFTVDNRRARFVAFLFRNPHLFECGQRGRDWSSDPFRVFTFRRGDDFDLHYGWSQSSNFFLRSVSDSQDHGAATRQHCVGVQVLTDVHVALHDKIVCGLMDACKFHSKERRLKHGLRASEALVANADDLTIRKFIALP